MPNVFESPRSRSNSNDNNINNIAAANKRRFKK